MNGKEKTLTGVFCLVLLIFSLLMAAWVPLRAALDASAADLSLSLETSQGRERKQRMEYDQVQEALPLARAELAAVQPRADAAAEEVRLLKEERKALRVKLKELGTASESAGENKSSGEDGQEEAR